MWAVNSSLCIELDREWVWHNPHQKGSILPLFKPQRMQYKWVFVLEIWCARAVVKCNIKVGVCTLKTIE